MTAASDLWSFVLLAVGLLFVAEGLLPCLSPQRWRDAVEKASKLANGQLRFIGLISVLLGTSIVLYVVA